MAKMGRVVLLAHSACLLVLLAVSMFHVVNATVITNNLKVGYYKKSCPNAESIVYNTVLAAYKKNKTVAPGILRIQFHDCMVQGCDASLLLDGSAAEKSSPINANLHGFEVFDTAKTALEKYCPGVVSCADIVAFAARDSVFITGGQGWNVPAGRRDGLVSNINDPIVNLPSSEMNVPLLLPFFTRKGLNAKQMVDLLGSHTIGISHCFFIQGRLFAYPSKNHIDPSLPKSFLQSLQKQCPKNVTTPFAGGFNHALNMDVKTPGKFDSNYYLQIVNQRGLMISDQSLYTDSRTKGRVIANTNIYTFFNNFAKAMVALTEVDVKTGSAGQIRKNCRVVNK